MGRLKTKMKKLKPLRDGKKDFTDKLFFRYRFPKRLKILYFFLFISCPFWAIFCDSKSVCLFVCLLIWQPSMMFAVLEALEQSVIVLIKQSSLGRTTPAITFITVGPHCGAIPLNVMACFLRKRKKIFLFAF